MLYKEEISCSRERNPSLEEDDFYLDIWKIRNALPSNDSLELINVFNSKDYSFCLESRKESLKDLIHVIIENGEALCEINAIVIISFLKKASKYDNNVSNFCFNFSTL